mmetsp:Transcript_3833/g.7641  ORF Transcript_3833/g.7641 Transcript_3833/m.7641 type:complete len:237 (-) Transcript_3833:63-773(-)
MQAAEAAAARRGAALGPPSPQRRCLVVLATSGARSEMAAVESVFRQCTIEGVRTRSGVNEQPHGHEEALRGAANRLDAAKVVKPGADYYVAMESSLSQVWVPQEAEGGELRYYDTGWVMLERQGGHRKAAPAAAVELPTVDVKAAFERGLERTTVGALVSERVGLLQGREPHGWLTAGRRDREALLGEAISVALGQLERADRPQAGNVPSGRGLFKRHDSAAAAAAAATSASSQSG